MSQSLKTVVAAGQQTGAEAQASAFQEGSRVSSAPDRPGVPSVSAAVWNSETARPLLRVDRVDFHIPPACRRRFALLRKSSEAGLVGWCGSGAGGDLDPAETPSP